VPLIIIGVYSASLSMLYGTIITAKEKTKINSLISIIGASVSVTLNIIFLPKYGLFTAAVVSSFAMTIMLSISIWYAKLNVSHYRPMFSFLLVVLSIYILVYVLHIDNIIVSIALKSIALLVVFFGMSLILLINPIKMIKGLIKK
jgi:O-antigen/teichoic acid export membrane protein